MYAARGRSAVRGREVFPKGDAFFYNLFCRADFVVVQFIFSESVAQGSVFAEGQRRTRKGKHRRVGETLYAAREEEVRYAAKKYFRKGMPFFIIFFSDPILWSINLILPRPYAAGIAAYSEAKCSTRRGKCRCVKESVVRGMRGGKPHTVEMATCAEGKASPQKNSHSPRRAISLLHVGKNVRHFIAKLL